VFHRRSHRLHARRLRNVVLNGLRRRRISDADARAFLRFATQLRVTLVDRPSYDEVFVLAERHNLTVYDAAYLDLAMRERLPLATLDKALIRAASQTGVAIFRAADAAVQ
jgi:predicted nucleic acid-binding protein